MDLNLSMNPSTPQSAEESLESTSIDNFKDPTNNSTKAISKPQTINDKITATTTDPTVNTTNTDTNPTPIPGTSALSIPTPPTNHPDPKTSTSLTPIPHWVPPRPEIIPRTPLSAAEIEQLRAENKAREIEKLGEGKRKQIERDMMAAAVAEKTRIWEEERGRELGMATTERQQEEGKE